MLIIRPQQMDAFRLALMRDLEARTARHVQHDFPSQCAEAGEEGTRLRVHTGIQRAQFHGFTEEYDIVRYVDLSFALEPDFDRNGRYPWAEEILADQRYSPEVKIDLITQLANQRVNPQPEEPPEEEAGPGEPEHEEEFDGIVIEEEPPAADPNLAEPYDGELPTDPDELPPPKFPDYLEFDPHFK